MARLFESFDEAWRAFLARAEPLEWFFGDFPEDEDAVLEGWLVAPSREVRAAAARMQARLAHLDWLAPVPDHFLHLWLGQRDRLGDAPERWPGLAPIEVEVGPPTCFHSAVVGEVHGDLEPLVAGSRIELRTFLPHVSLAYTRRPHDARELRETLVPLRGERLGRMRLDEVLHVRFPAARTTLLQPWQIVRRVALRSPR